MRIKYTLLNISAGLGSQLIIVILSFVSRTVFIHSLGIEYLGINMLFMSMLAMLSLAEAGIGQSIVYNLYKPVADDDRPKILALMRLYRNAYWIIAGIVLLLGLCLLPFLGMIVKDTNVDHIIFIYSLFLVNTAVPYLFVYKHSFLNVNQKNYIVTSTFLISTILSTILKIVILLYTQNYILFLVIESFISIVTSIALAWWVDRMYPYLKQKFVAPLDPATKANLIRNIKAIVLQNVGVYFIFGVDSILISTFISVIAVGFYSNYRMLIDICRNLMNQIFNNMYHSIGNLVAKETKDKIYHIYKAAALLNFWLYSLCSILLYIALEPFIKVWIGDEYVMGPAVVLILVITFYERGMRNTITTVKTTAGIFHEDRFAPLIQAAINLAISIVLVQYIGLPGIFLGTWISSMLIPFWLTPYLVYKKVFALPLKQYFKQYVLFTGIGLIACGASIGISRALPHETLLQLVIQIVICFVMINLLYVLIFYKTDEFKYLVGIAKTLASKLPRLSWQRTKSRSQ